MKLKTLLRQLQTVCIQIYPNPVRGIINFSWPNQLKISHLNIYNSSGQVVYHNECKTTQHQIDFRAMQAASGIYFVQLIGIENKAFNARLIYEQ